jgi:Flp pilus assembly protein TadG
MSRFRQRSHGQSLVEFALLLPVLIVTLLGMLDFGRAIYAYNAVSEAARNGARVAIVNQTPGDICLVAASRAVALGLPTTCAPNGNPGTQGVWVTTSGLPACTPVPDIDCLQSVRVTYEFRAITPVIGAIVGPINISSTSTVPVESACLNNGCPQP